MNKPSKIALTVTLLLGISLPGASFAASGWQVGLRNVKTGKIVGTKTMLSPSEVALIKVDGSVLKYCALDEEKSFPGKGSALAMDARRGSCVMANGDHTDFIVKCYAGTTIGEVEIVVGDSKKGGQFDFQVTCTGSGV